MTTTTVRSLASRLWDGSSFSECSLVGSEADHKRDEVCGRNVDCVGLSLEELQEATKHLQQQQQQQDSPSCMDIPIHSLSPSLLLSVKQCCRPCASSSAAVAATAAETVVGSQIQHSATHLYFVSYDSSITLTQLIDSLQYFVARKTREESLSSSAGAAAEKTLSRDHFSPMRIRFWIDICHFGQLPVEWSCHEWGWLQRTLQQLLMPSQRDERSSVTEVHSLVVNPHRHGEVCKQHLFQYLCVLMTLRNHCSFLDKEWTMMSSLSIPTSMRMHSTSVAYTVTNADEEQALLEQLFPQDALQNYNNSQSRCEDFLAQLTEQMEDSLQLLEVAIVRRSRPDSSPTPVAGLSLLLSLVETYEDINVIYMLLQHGLQQLVVDLCCRWLFVDVGTSSVTGAEGPSLVSQLLMTKSRVVEDQSKRQSLPQLSVAIGPAKFVTDVNGSSPRTALTSDSPSNFDTLQRLKSSTTTATMTTTTNIRKSLEDEVRVVPTTHQNSVTRRLSSFARSLFFAASLSLSKKGQSDLALKTKVRPEVSMHYSSNTSVMTSIRSNGHTMATEGHDSEGEDDEEEQEVVHARRQENLTPIPRACAAVSLLFAKAPVTQQQALRAQALSTLEQLVRLFAEEEGQRMKERDLLQEDSCVLMWIEDLVELLMIQAKFAEAEVVLRMCVNDLQQAYQRSNPSSRRRCLTRSMCYFSLWQAQCYMLSERLPLCQFFCNGLFQQLRDTITNYEQDGGAKVVIVDDVNEEMQWLMANSAVLPNNSFAHTPAALSSTFDACQMNKLMTIEACQCIGRLFLNCRCYRDAEKFVMEQYQLSMELFPMKSLAVLQSKLLFAEWTLLVNRLSHAEALATECLQLSNQLFLQVKLAHSKTHQSNTSSGVSRLPDRVFAQSLIQQSKQLQLRVRAAIEEVEAKQQEESLRWTSFDNSHILQTSATAVVNSSAVPIATPMANVVAANKDKSTMTTTLGRVSSSTSFLRSLF